MSPGKGCVTTQAFTTPYVLAEIPAQEGAAAHFLRRDVVRDCDAAPSSCAAVLCEVGTRCVELRSDPPQARCVPEEPVRDPCATVKCASGTHCVAEEVQCVKAPCPPVARCVPNAPPPEDPCALVRCAAGTHCEVKQVQCVKAPCPPVAQCVPDVAPVACGGLAALRCPGAGACQDDPTDSCVPGRGADCGGVCACTALGKCVEGSVWDSSPAVCGCVPGKTPPPPPKGEACGKNTCKAGEFCCNASCGICAPKGGVCTQQACI